MKILKNVDNEEFYRDEFAENLGTLGLEVIDMKIWNKTLFKRLLKEYEDKILEVLIIIKK